MLDNANLLIKEVQMRFVGQLSDRFLALFVPRASAAASSIQACEERRYCQQCAPVKSKPCWAQYCDGQYVNGACGLCGSC